MFGGSISVVVTATNNGYAFSVLVQPPGPFMITGPTAPVNAQTATITWQASERAVEYDLVVSTAADCSVSIGEDYPGLTELSQFGCGLAIASCRRAQLCFEEGGGFG